MSKPRLYLFVGYPGAGKTTLARLIHQRTGAVHIWADQERKAMFGQPEHTPAENAKLYEYLNAKTAELLASGQSVIFDTNFNFYKDRQHLRSIAEQTGAEPIIIWVTTSPELAKQRAINDAASQDTRILGDMPPETFDRIASHLEPPREDEKVIKIDGTGIDQDRVCALLDI